MNNINVFKLFETAKELEGDACKAVNVLLEAAHFTLAATLKADLTDEQIRTCMSLVSKKCAILRAKAVAIHKQSIGAKTNAKSEDNPIEFLRKSFRMGGGNQG